MPPKSDPENPAGNHVVVDCAGIYVELAHLRKGSLLAENGARLSVSDQIGRVGNSGNTTEPHLHVHGFDPETKRAIAMEFDGRWPVRNRVFRH